jgi:subtilisin family serine protease
VSDAGPTDIFAELLALATSDRLLLDPRATGEGVRVCVIDSGVESDLLISRCRQRGQEGRPIEGGLFRADRAEPLPYEGHQSTPHGTTVADIILTLAPQVRLFSADIIGPSGAGADVETLLRALHWAVHEWRCHIVNLSLGVPEHRLQPVSRRNQLLRAIEEAYFRDVLLIAAAHNEHPLTLSYPALFSPPLVSVDRGDFDDPLRFAYALRERIEFQAYSKGYLGPFASEPATSWAAPHLSGLAARLLSLRPGLKPFEVKTLLYWMSRPPG